MNWRWYNWATFKVKDNFNTKTISECDLLFNKHQLKSSLPKQNKMLNNNLKKIVFDVFKSYLIINNLKDKQIVNISKFQKQFNYKLCCVKSVFEIFKMFWIKSKSVMWKREHKIKGVKPRKFKETHTFHNKAEFEILEVDNNTITFTNNDILRIQDVDAYFQPHYARTIDSFQGDKIKIPFGIIGLKNEHFTVERLNSAIGRATCKDLVYIDYYDENKKFKSKEYPNHVEVIVKPKIEVYSNVWFYTVYHEGILMYIGTTTQTIQQRKEQHINDDHDDKFHKWLKTINHEDVEFESIYDKPMNFDCWGDVEDFEMKLVQDMKPILNTRRKTCRQELIKLTEAEINEVMTKEEFNDIKYYKTKEKETTPHFEDFKATHKIRIRFSYEGQRFEHLKGYKKIGYDKAKQELETWFHDKIQELKNKDICNYLIEFADNDNDNISVSLNKK